MSLNYEEMSWRDVRNNFRRWREDNERRSDDVIQLWEAILADKLDKTGNERHLILEQVIVAALDTGRIDIAGKCIKELNADFPESLRVLKFKTMRLEAMEQYDEAIDLLDVIIAKDETNAVPRKRKISILKARGRRIDAIKEMNDYLKKFMSDQEAWHELCNLYMAEGDYTKAAFCMEEVLLHNPHSHLIHQRLGDIRYTMGGVENYEIARTYYSQAIKLNPNNLRALYGLYLCCCNIGYSKGTKRKEARRLSEWALEQIKLLTTRVTPRKDVENTENVINALESAFSSLDIKSN